MLSKLSNSLLRAGTTLKYIISFILYVRVSRAVCSYRSFHSTDVAFSKDQAQIPQYSWTNPDNVPKGTNLKKYGLDLTDLAKQGKLDPVIGRDEEIRRTLEVYIVEYF